MHVRNVATKRAVAGAISTGKGPMIAKATTTTGDAIIESNKGRSQSDLAIVNLKDKVDLGDGQQQIHANTVIIISADTCTIAK